MKKRTKPIKDEFTGRVDISRQRRYQLRKARDGLCVTCGAPAVTKHYCEEHRQKNNVRTRERQRALLGQGNRNHNAESYSFGQLAKKKKAAAPRRKKAALAS